MDINVEVPVIKQLRKDIDEIVMQLEGGAA